MLEVTLTITIPESELETSFARSGGPGGQNVNKVNSKAILRWHFQGSAVAADVKERFRQAYAARITKDGDVLVTSDRFRDQGRNLEDCRSKLAELLREVAVPPKKRKKTKPTRSSRERRHQSKRKQGEKKQNRRAGSWND